MSGPLDTEQGASTSGGSQEEEDASRGAPQAGPTSQQPPPAVDEPDQSPEDQERQGENAYQSGSSSDQSAGGMDGRLESSTNNKAAPHSRTPSPGMAPLDKIRSPPHDSKSNLAAKRIGSRPPSASGPQPGNAGYQQSTYPQEQFGGIQRAAGPVQGGGMGHGWLTKEHQQLAPHQDMARGWPQVHGYHEQPRYSPPQSEKEVHYGPHGGDLGPYQGMRQPMPMYEDHGMHGNYQYPADNQGIPYNNKHMQPAAPNRMQMHGGMYGQPKGHRGRSYNHPGYPMDQVDPHMARAHQEMLAQQQQQQMRSHAPQNIQRGQYRNQRDGSHGIDKQFDGMRLESGGGSKALDVHAPEYGKKYSPPNQEFLNFSPGSESPRAFSPSGTGSRVPANESAKQGASRSALGCIGDGRRCSSGAESEEAGSQKGGLSSALKEGGEGYEKPSSKMSWASVMANGMAKDDEKKSDSEDGEPNLDDKNWVEKMISKQQRENEQLQAAAIKLAQTVVNYEMRQGKAAGADKPSVEMELQGLNGTHFSKGAPICVHFLQHGQCTWKSRSCPNSDTHHCGRCGGPHGTKAHSYLLKVLDQMR